MSDTIICPNCSCNIEITSTMTAQLREQLRKELEAEARRKQNALAVLEEVLRQRELDLDESLRSVESEVAQRVGKERERLLLEAATKAQESIALELQDLRDQVVNTKRKLTQAQQAELQLRKERRDLEDAKNALELTVNRKLDEERGKIREDAKREADADHRLHEAEKDNLVADLRRQIDVLKRKSEQGSQQAQGEVMELEIEDLLRAQFPADTIEPVLRGVHGGDVLQHVHDGNGSVCGTMLWESKRTKAWNDGWLPKLREDQRAARAHVAVLATTEMPKGITTFACIEGVWVTSRSCLVGLATALRAGILDVGRTKRSLQGKQTKVEMLHSYLAGSEFRQRVEGIVEAFMTLKDDLESEKRSMHRIWSKREKQLERAAMTTAGLYGDLGGILGEKLPQIANLELAVIAADASSDALQLAGVSQDEDSPF